LPLSKTVSELENELSGSGYGALKGQVAEAVVELLAPIRTEPQSCWPIKANLIGFWCSGQRKQNTPPPKRSSECMTLWDLLAPAGEKSPRVALVKISVIGCGYLGAVHAASMAQLGHEVVGIDVDQARLSMLAEGIAPFHEPGFEDLLLAKPAN
jgi:hypothetical protein